MNEADGDIPTFDAEPAWCGSVLRVHCEHCRTIHSHARRDDGIYRAGCVDRASPLYGRRIRLIVRNDRRRR